MEKQLDFVSADQLDEMSHLCGASECHLVHVHVSGDGGTG